ncbi:MAG: DUF922 domain-containing protein [Chitinophagaceae bacterium]|nr:DUF922 domain-containing protein [Chitinophagaceae bacterium]
MVKYFFLTLLFFPLQQAQEAHLIDWKGDRKLTWKDFQGEPVLKTDNAALTSSNINFQFGYGSSGFRYSITCRFDKSRSWVRVKNDHILAHEQAHFDIAELHARKLKKALSSYKYNERTVSNDINRIYEAIMKGHHQMQTDYDQQTDHSRNFEKQSEWEIKVAEQLLALQSFANYK